MKSSEMSIMASSDSDSAAGVLESLDLAELWSSSSEVEFWEVLSGKWWL
ncbi:hypothetical protein A2U01_0070159, partial [Trifolium medium]|nr:hypothetical protein [Trifolium medium]